MDIGAKIKTARIQSGLTQEQAAEALGVSRQTISNWENEKTYPDIVSVVKMSDLYHVSLDHLLKGDKPDYLDYLSESTDTVQSRRKQSFMALMLVYLGIWAFSLIVFWFFSSGSDAMGYWIMFLWVVLPVTTCRLPADRQERLRRTAQVARLHRLWRTVHAGALCHLQRGEHGGDRPVAPAVVLHAPDGCGHRADRHGHRTQLSAPPRPDRAAITGNTKRAVEKVLRAAARVK